MGMGELEELLSEKYEYSLSRKSAIRTVCLPNSREIRTRIRTVDFRQDCDDAHSAFDYAYLRKRTPPSEPDTSETVRAVDLFCGCGGLSLGAIEACRAMGKRLTVIAAIDREPAFLRVYKTNFPRSKTYEREIERVIDGDLGIKPTKSETDLLREVDRLDILLAGPPCEGYSDLNNITRRNDARNALYERVARFVELSRPQHVLIENVPAVIHGKEKAVQNSIEAISGIGYNIDSGVVNLAAVGVPQRRRRHVVVASKAKELLIDDVVDKYSIKHKRSVRWAIGDLEVETPDKEFTIPSNLSQDNMKRAKYLHENDVFDLPDRLRPACHREEHSYRSMYGRIRYNEPSQTITSGFMSPGQGRFLHSTQLRTLTPHEAARLQFFPDFFDFSSVKVRRLLSSGIGNAAPMKLSYVFCLELLA